MPEQGSSFIPKSGVKTVQRTRSTRRIYLLAYISYVIFFSTIFAVIGVYIYGATVSRNLTSIKESLAEEQKRFDVADIESMKQLEKRLELAERILNESTAPSRLLPDIEAIVASNIYFTGLSYTQLINRQFQIDLIGRAENFNQIVGQQQLVKNSSLLQNATVVEYDYNVGEGSEGSVLGNATLSFTFSDTRDLSAISYIPEAPTLDAQNIEENVVIPGSATSSGSSVPSTTPEVPPAVGAPSTGI